MYHLFFIDQGTKSEFLKAFMALDESHSSQKLFQPLLLMISIVVIAPISSAIRELDIPKERETPKKFPFEIPKNSTATHGTRIPFERVVCVTMR